MSALDDLIAMNQPTTPEGPKVTKLAHKLADLIARPAPPPPGGFTDTPQVFAALNTDGTVMCIGHEGEWYFPRKPSIRVQLHNWLVNR